MLELEVVRDVSRLGELQEDWWNLGGRLENWTPFQSPEWLIVWWKHFGSGELNIFAFRDARGELVGLMPLFLHEWDGHKQFTLLGSGISDYLEPAILPSYSTEVLDCLASELNSRPNWTRCYWQDLNAGTPLSRLPLSEGAFSVNVEADQPCSEISLGASFAEYWSERPRGLRRNVRRYGEKACSNTVPEFSFTTELDRDLLQALMTLHASRWRRQGEAGMIAVNKSSEFLKEVTEQLSRRKMCSFFSMRLAGRIVAVILSFPYRGTLFSYLSGFDAEYEELGLGRLLLHYAIRRSFESGFKTWNFLRGQESYKLDWGACPVPKSRIVIQRETTLR